MRELTLEEIGFVSGGGGKGHAVDPKKLAKQIAKLEKKIVKETAQLAADTEALVALTEPLTTGG